MTISCDTRRSLSWKTPSIAAPVRPWKKNAGIAFALAWLANDCADRSCFDEFWKELENPERWRSANLTRLINGIYLVLGVRRVVGRMHRGWGAGCEPPIGSVIPGWKANREWDQQH
ncbi:hypothetical protein [Sphingomonas cavernae]|uniref:hypothetical protein n=1 Tax=Sphingomonas cavernae TaxID=2320861 RepID=UPI0011C3CF61|nr:hypothetical protein [Sphingomonas cavernae]